MTNDFALKRWQQQWSCPFSPLLFHRTQIRLEWHGNYLWDFIHRALSIYCILKHISRSVPRAEQFHELFKLATLDNRKDNFPTRFSFLFPVSAEARDKSLKRKFALILLEAEMHVSWFFLVEACFPSLLSTLFLLSILIYVCLWNCSCIMKCSHVSLCCTPHSRRFKARHKAVKKGGDRKSLQTRYLLMFAVKWDSNRWSFKMNIFRHFCLRWTTCKTALFIF